MCKRKRSQKKSTRAVPARHPTALPQHQPSLPQKAARHMRPQTRFRSDSAGLCGRLCRPSPRNNRFTLFVAAKLVRVSSSISVLQVCAVGWNDAVLKNTICHYELNTKFIVWCMTFDICSTPHTSRLCRATFLSRGRLRLRTEWRLSLFGNKVGGICSFHHI